MIDYVEIRNSARQLTGIIDTAQSVIWRSDYYGAGYFEIYVAATSATVTLLQVGNYVTRTGCCPDVGIIETVRITYNAQDGRMVIASGRLAKSILDRRLIYNLTGTSIKPTVIRGLVEVAARSLVSANIIASSVAARNIGYIALGELAGITKTIVSETGEASDKQTSYGGLLEYTDALLQEYELGARMTLDTSTLNLLYTVYEGADRSMGNTAGNAPLIFSQDFDNLLTSDYATDATYVKNTALVGGEGEGTDRFCILTGASNTGINRREIWVDASGQSRKYSDGNGNDATYTDAEYAALLETAARTQLAMLTQVDTFDGTIDLTNSGLVYGVDYDIGDVVTIQDVALGLYINARLLEVTEVQDESGYNIDITYGI